MLDNHELQSEYDRSSDDLELSPAVRHLTTNPLGQYLLEDSAQRTALLAAMASHLPVSMLRSRVLFSIGSYHMDLGGANLSKAASAFYESVFCLFLV